METAVQRNEKFQADCRASEQYQTLLHQAHDWRVSFEDVCKQRDELLAALQLMVRKRRKVQRESCI